MERVVTTCDHCGKELSEGDGGTLPGVCVVTWFYGKTKVSGKLHHFCNYEHLIFYFRIEKKRKDI